MNASPGRAGRPAALTAAAIPLAIVALASGLWWLSDRLLVIGPLDRASFGWLVVVPLWLAAPIVAGFAWWREPTRTAARAAAIVTVVAGVAAAWLLWRSVATLDCGSLGTLVSPGELIVPSLVSGVFVGGGIAAGSLLTREALRRASRRRAIAVGLVASGISTLLSLIVMFALAGGQNCNRPLL